MPNYRKQRLRPATVKEFKGMLARCRNLQEQALITVLYYWGIRISEAIALHHTDLYLDGDLVFLKIKRLKRSKQTKPIPFFFNSIGMDYLLSHHISAEKHNRDLFPFTRQNGWKICHRLGVYPHFFRMNRITEDLNNHGINDVISRMGITIRSIDYYVAEGNLKKMAMRDAKRIKVIV